jgi:HEAT repeat protein
MPAKKNVNLNHTLAQLRDEKNKISSASVAALSGANKQDLAEFARVWVDVSTARRRAVARQMVALAEEDFKLDFDLLFRHLLNDEDAQVRAAGIEGLWESEDAALIKPMIGFLRSDPDAQVRAAAADALGRFMLLAEYGRLREEQADIIGEALLATIRSDSEEVTVRARAVEAVAYWSNEIVREIISAAYEDDMPEMRASAIVAMGHTADTRWRQTTQDELDSPDPRMRFEAARASGELENREATERLIEMLNDDDREVQSAAITALGQIGGKAAKRALTEIANSDDELLSMLANDALQELEFADGSDLLLFDIREEALRVDADELDESAEVDDEESGDDEDDDWSDEEDELSDEDADGDV